MEVKITEGTIISVEGKDYIVTDVSIVAEKNTDRYVKLYIADDDE